MAQMPPIYLDHNATTPILPEAADAVREASLRYGANPESQHEPGRQARRALEAARERIAEILGATADDRIVFTSGGTESNNLAITGLAQRAGSSPTLASTSSPTPASGPRLIISPLEHPSVYRTAEHLAVQGWHVDRLPVSVDGVVRIEAFGEVLRPDTRLVSVMLASHETGVVQPVAGIAAICRERGMPVHTDATQVVGKLPVKFRDLGVDALTFTAHKFHGPIGVGALLVRHGDLLAPSLHGGFQQAGLRPGTECVPLVLGMLAALAAWAREADARRERMAALRDRLERQITAGDPLAVVIGAAAQRLPHTSNIAFAGLDRQALAMAFDLAGVACSTGSACASGSSEPSPALVAMGLSEEQISSSIRFSLGATTTVAEVDEAARRILSVANRLRRE
jgi:cysteine desulfurase